MTEQQIIARFYAVAEGKRHRHYKRTVEYSAECTAFSTGEGMDKFLRKFARRESDQLFKQRVDITQHVTKAVVSNIVDVFRKAPRSQRKRELWHDGENAGATETLEGVLGRFTASMSADAWAKTRLLELNATDPNAWIVIEWGSFDNRRERASPYPFEVGSADALDLSFDGRGELMYLVARTVSPVTELERITVYMRNRSVSLDQIDVKIDAGQTPQNAKVIGGKHYIETEHEPHNLGYVPAFRAGYLRNSATRGDTALCIFDAALPYLHKTVKSNSELDLTASLHAHPLPIRAAETCDAQGCYGGKVMDADGKENACNSCSGTGFKKPTSTQEEIVVTMPRNPADMIDLDKLLVYKAPPVEFLVWLDQYVVGLTEKAKRAVFNSDIVQQSSIAKTATEKGIDLEAVYDTLFPYMQHISETWRFIVYGVARITGLDNGLQARLLIQRDGKMKGFDALMADLKAANETGASPVVIKHIQADIARTMFADEPSAFRKWEVSERYNPFSGQEPASIMYLLASDLVPKKQKVLYANLGHIFEKIEKDTPDFYLLERSRQDEVVEQALKGIIDDIYVAEPDISDSISEPDRLGKVPLALQQLALARQRATDVGDLQTSNLIGGKINELLDGI